MLDFLFSKGRRLVQQSKKALDEKRYEECVRLAAEAVQAGAQAEGFTMSALGLLGLNRWDDVLTAVQHALSAEGLEEADRHVCLYVRGQALCQRGEVDQARMCYERLLGVNEDYALALASYLVHNGPGPEVPGANQAHAEAGFTAWFPEGIVIDHGPAEDGTVHFLCRGQHQGIHFFARRTSYPEPMASKVREADPETEERILEAETRVALQEADPHEQTELTRPLRGIQTTALYPDQMVAVRIYLDPGRGRSLSAMVVAPFKHAGRCEIRQFLDAFRPA